MNTLCPKVGKAQWSCGYSECTCHRKPALVPAQAPSRVPCSIAFVAEAPSHEEIKKLRPLCGPSGRIFNSLLATVGIDREECLVTNVFSEKVPDNDLRHWCVDLRTARGMGWTDLSPIGDLGFLRPEYRWHLDRLERELQAYEPTIVVPLGGTALWGLTGNAGIGSVRGTVVTARGRTLCPTYHPSFVMKQWKYYTVVARDIQKAKEIADGKVTAHVPHRELLLRPTLQDIRAYIPRLVSSRLLAVDIETGWGQITCIGFAPNDTEAICIPFLDRTSTTRNYWDDPRDELEAWKLVREILQHPVPKLGQNFAAYDAYWLIHKKHISPRNMWHDTRLMHHALWPELPKDLEFMGNSHATQGAWKYMGRREKRDD